MNVTAAALRELHRIHQQLTDLRERLERGPKQVQARQRAVQQIEAKLAAAQEEAKQARMTADRKQLDLKTGENKILDLKTKLNTCSSNKEYQALMDQIAAAEMAGSVLADEILEGLEKIDTLEVKIEQAKANVAKARDEFDHLKADIAASLESVRADIARLEGDLTAAESTLPPDFRVDYDRVIRSKGADALAPVDGDVCTGCGQQFTPNMQNNMALGQTAFCPACGRLMYLPEDLSTRGGD